MKKFISVLLVFAILAGLCGISVTAQKEDYSAYPESRHDYENDSWEEWEYVHPTEAEGLFITFSAETCFEPEYVDDETGEYKGGDYIDLYAVNGDDKEWLGFFSGDELASKTLYIPASGFSITLNTDDSVTEYGFKIERVDTVAPENVNVVCYNFESNETGIEKYYECFNKGEPAVIADSLPSELLRLGSFRNGCEFRCGWATEPEGELVYDDGMEVMLNESYSNLYVAWLPLLIRADEVFSFSNFDKDFNLAPPDPNVLFPKIYHYMTPKDHAMLLRNARRLGLPGWITYKSLEEYPQKLFGGACFGLACTAFLQHHGVIDLLSLQEGADTVDDLKVSPEVISAVNYYQSLTILSFLCQNQAYEVGSDEYKKQLKAVYDTVSGGTPVLLSMLDDNYIFGNNHSVLVTGAYTDTQGNHYLLAYGGDENYAEKTISKYPIAPDFSSFGNGKTFYWTADYSHLDAFDMEGEGSPVSWYLKFIPQMFTLIRMLFRILPLAL